MPWSKPQSAPVSGCQSKPMVLRRPLAKMVRLLPSGFARRMVALSGLVSAQALQVEPAEM